MYMNPRITSGTVEEKNTLKNSKELSAFTENPSSSAVKKHFPASFLVRLVPFGTLDTRPQIPDVRDFNDKEIEKLGNLIKETK